MAFHSRFWVLLLTNTAAQTTDFSTFKAEAPALIHEYIFSHYSDFAESELTFRDLKQHVEKQMRIPYTTLGETEYAEVIEDATDLVANTCDMGSISLEKCRKKIESSVSSMGAPAKDET